jgi:hypothetical protein
MCPPSPTLRTCECDRCCSLTPPARQQQCMTPTIAAARIQRGKSRAIRPCATNQNWQQGTCPLNKRESRAAHRGKRDNIVNNVLKGYAAVLVAIDLVKRLVQYHRVVQSAKASEDSAACSTQHAARSMQHAARSTQHAARSTQHAARSTQHAARSKQHILRERGQPKPDPTRQTPRSHAETHTRTRTHTHTSLL